MNTTDPFIEAASAEAWRRHPDSVDIETGEPVDDWGFEEQGRRDFQAGAEWARTHLAAQEPTDAEREAAMEALGCRLRSLLNGQTTCDEHGRRASMDDVCWAADAALSAARAARRDEEKRND